MKKNLYAATALAVIASTSPALAEGIFINTLTDTYDLHDNDPDYWDDMGYRARDIVEAGEHIGSTVAEAGHNLLGLDYASPQARILYLGTAGLLNMRFQQANAIMFGHEYIHFQFHDLEGRPDHYFYNFDTNEELDFSEAYLNTLIWGGPKATATSRGNSGRDELPSEQSIMRTAAGVDWQMQYSERWVQKSLMNRQSVFSMPGYLGNRTKLGMYALSDSLSDTGVVTGDVNKVAAHYSSLGHETDAGDIALWGLAASALSPMTWNSFSALNSYVEYGDLEMQDPFFTLANGLRLTWDIPQYLNADGMTLAPMAYTETDFGVIGIGMEIGVIGDSAPETNISYMHDFGKTDVAAHITWAETGSHLELEAGYELIQALSLEGRFSASAGDTLRGVRNNPTGGETLYAGISFHF
jgi:hypothetical protein